MPAIISAWQIEVVKRRSGGCADIQAATGGAGCAAMTAERTLVSRMNINRNAAVQEPARAGQLDIVGAAERREARADAVVEIGFGRALGLFEGFLEYVADLGLHRVSMLGGANTQALFESRIDIADRQGGHGSLVQLHALIVRVESVEGKIWALLKSRLLP